jgi:26S proteasome regulatory subunit T1
MSQLPPPTPRRALSLRIRDQGGGVSPANISRIFSYAFTTASHLKRGAYAPPPARSSADSDDSSELGRLGVLNYEADSGADEGGLSGPYAAQHVGGGVGLSTGLGSGVGTIAGLGYGLPMSRLYTRLVRPDSLNAHVFSTRHAGTLAANLI